MKTINNYINESHFTKPYTGNKNPNISNIETQMILYGVKENLVVELL